MEDYSRIHTPESSIGILNNTIQAYATREKALTSEIDLLTKTLSVVRSDNYWEMSHVKERKVLQDKINSIKAELERANNENTRLANMVLLPNERKFLLSEVARITNIACEIFAFDDSDHWDEYSQGVLEFITQATTKFLNKDIYEKNKES